MDDTNTPRNEPLPRPETNERPNAAAARNADGDDLVLAPPVSESETSEVREAQLADSKEPRLPLNPTHFRQLKRRRMLPLALFGLTCVSTFYVGAELWLPGSHLYASITEGLMPVRRMLLANWQDGLIYMGCVLAILLTHEMGHFLATIHYRIPASYPYFLPLPISPIGTMGAVIGMDGLRANRREMFDIGIAGPLAGLVVAIPITWIGVMQLDFTQPGGGPYELDVPLAARYLLDAVQPRGYTQGQTIAFNHLNPFFMAGWVGLLITGLNMMPVSQLDGGHVIYTLFKKKAHWVARIFMATTIALMAFDLVTYHLWLMVALILLIGTDHPPTRDDEVRLGWGRVFLGIASLSIPFLCFAPKLIIMK
jgi:membrane-associated protease RseP (regulator of RpoE activity)